MNFFDAQDRARRATRWLVIVYVIATTLIVLGVTAVVGAAFYSADTMATPPDPSLLIATAVITALFIVGATLYKTAALSSGGGKVAADMGGTLVPADVHDPARRRLRNVVEEISIASGVPVPEIYVLEEESSINAFAAGFTSGDAAIAVTRGTLELLSRDELQGVIAHEFSHILNGDMRLNIRMMGVLFGIMVLGLIGRIVMRGGYHTGIGVSRRDRGAPVVMLIGIGLTILGWIGVFFARIIKAAVSRQREYLADASAVQFTRNNEGLASALKKIGGYRSHSFIRRVDPEEVSHMLFARGSPRLVSLFATHPPLTERIRALDPSFSEDDYPESESLQRSSESASEQVAGFAGTETIAPRELAAGDLSSTIAESVGHPETRHIAYAERLRASIPAEIYDAAHSPDLVVLLTLALALDPDNEEYSSDTSRQFRLITEQLGDRRATLVRRYHEYLHDLGPAYRLPLLEISFPALKLRPLAQLEFLSQLVKKIIELDGQLDLREYCFYRILASQLFDAVAPGKTARNRVSRKAARQAAVDLLRIVAWEGNNDDASRRRAFDAGLGHFQGWVEKFTDHDPSARTVDLLDRSLDILSGINSAGRKSLLEAVTAAITVDGNLSLAEAELLRVICVSLDCPLPPIATLDEV